MGHGGETGEDTHRVSFAGFFLLEREASMARKGDLKAVKHLNIGLDRALSAALEARAAENERKLTEEVRYAIRQYLKSTPAPVEEAGGVSV